MKILKKIPQASICIIKLRSSSMYTPSRELVVGHLSLEFAAGTTTQTQRSKIDITIQPIQVVRYAAYGNCCQNQDRTKTRFKSVRSKGKKQKSKAEDPTGN